MAETEMATEIDTGTETETETETEIMTMMVATTNDAEGINTVAFSQWCFA